MFFGHPLVRFKSFAPNNWLRTVIFSAISEGTPYKSQKRVKIVKAKLGTTFSYNTHVFRYILGIILSGTFKDSIRDNNWYFLRVLSDIFNEF